MRIGDEARSELHRTLLVSAALTGLGLLVGLGLWAAAPSTYVARVQVFTQPATQAPSVAVLAASPAVLDPIRLRLALPYTTQDVMDRVSTSVPGGSGIVDVVVRDTNAQRAGDIAKGIVSNLPSVLNSLNTATNTSSSSATTGSATPIAIAVVGQPTLSATPQSPSRPTYLALGALGGAVAAASVLAFLKRHRPMRQDQVRQVTQAPVLGTTGTGAGDTHPHRLRDNLRLATLDNPARSVVVADCRPGDGSTATVCSLALAFAEGGQRVVLIDADLTKERTAPRLTEVLGVPTGAGLTSVLLGDVVPESAMTHWHDLPLSVLGCGPLPALSTPLLASTAMSTLVERLAQDALVIIEAPELATYPDAAKLARHTDGLVLVTHLDQGPAAVQDAADRTREHGATLLGVVLHRPERRSGDSLAAPDLTAPALPAPALAHDEVMLATDHQIEAPSEQVVAEPYLVDEAVVHEFVSQETAYKETVHEETVHEEAVHEEAVYEEAAFDEPVPDQSPWIRILADVSDDGAPQASPIHIPLPPEDREPYPSQGQRPVTAASGRRARRLAETGTHGEAPSHAGRPLATNLIIDTDQVTISSLADTLTDPWGPTPGRHRGQL